MLGLLLVVAGCGKTTMETKMSSQLSETVEVDQATAPLELEVDEQDGKVKLLVRHPEIDRVCELWCYESGPFQRGKGVRRSLIHI